MFGAMTRVYAKSPLRRTPTISLGRYRRYRHRPILEPLETIGDADI